LVEGIPLGYDEIVAVLCLFVCGKILTLWADTTDSDEHCATS
jgi:hypothetical protein